MITIFKKDKDITPEDFLKRKRNPIYVILDNLRSAYNVGAIFRTGDAFLVEKLLLCGITAHPPNSKLKKTAMSSERYVPWEYIRETSDVLHSLKEKGIKILCCERTQNSTPLGVFRPTFPCAVVFGNEAEGLPENVLALSDEIIEIPMRGFKNSLNVATTVGIVLHEIARNLRVGDTER